MDRKKDNFVHIKILFSWAVYNSNLTIRKLDWKLETMYINYYKKGQHISWGMWKHLAY